MPGASVSKHPNPIPLAFPGLSSTRPRGEGPAVLGAGGTEALTEEPGRMLAGDWGALEGMAYRLPQEAGADAAGVSRWRPLGALFKLEVLGNTHWQSPTRELLGQSGFPPGPRLRRTGPVSLSPHSPHLTRRLGMQLQTPGAPRSPTVPN